MIPNSVLRVVFLVAPAASRSRAPAGPEKGDAGEGVRGVTSSKSSRSGSTTLALRLRARARIERPAFRTGMPRASKARTPRGDLSVALPGVTGVKPSASLSGVSGLRRRRALAFLLGTGAVAAATVAVAVFVSSAGRTGSGDSADGPRRCMMGM